MLLSMKNVHDSVEINRMLATRYRLWTINQFCVNRLDLLFCASMSLGEVNYGHVKENIY